MLPEEPVVALISFAGASRKGDLVVFVVLFGQVLEDRTAFEEADGLAIGEGISYGGDATIWVYSCKPRFFLDIGGDFDVFEFVWLSTRSVFDWFEKLLRQMEGEMDWCLGFAARWAGVGSSFSDVL